MSEATKALVFSVRRSDLVYDFASTFSDLFRVSMFSDETPSNQQGVRLQKSIGYDFQSECSPVVEILPFDESLLTKIGGTLSDYRINITLDDFGLGVRKLLFNLGLEEVSSNTRIPIDLSKIKDVVFYRGFEIKCFVTRKMDVDPKDSLIWSKSQQIYEAAYLAKASEEDALFEISWVTFPEEENQKDVLAYVDWKSAAVSTDIDVDCFEVKANIALRDQVTRLNNNRAFGGFCIRMLAEQILKELVIQCLVYADLTADPQVDSLHEKIKVLLGNDNLDFDELATRAQTADPLEKLQVNIEITKFLQRHTQIGSSLNMIKFGGY